VKKPSDALKEMLSQIRAAPAAKSSGSRVIDTGAASGGAEILREIDQTVLARRLVFRNRREEAIALIARRRRLILIEGIFPEGLAAEFPAVCGPLLSDMDDSGLARLAELLRRFSHGAETLVVDSAAPADATLSQTNGVPADALASAWGLDLYHRQTGAAGTSIADFTERCRDFFTTALVYSGEALCASYGSESELEELRSIARARAEGAKAAKLVSAQGGGDRHFSLLRQGVPGGRILVLAGQGEDMVLMLAGGADLANIMACWTAR